MSAGQTKRTPVTIGARTAASDRSVLCSIHQLSAQLFAMFDLPLMLPRTCGVQWYIGPLGEDGQQLTRYLQDSHARAR